MHLTIRLILALSLSASAALAQQPAPTSHPQRTVEFKAAETVEGGTQSPDAAIEEVRRRRPQVSLVRVRADFNHRLVQSAETL